MKKQIFYFTGVLLIMLSCDAISKMTQFNMEYNKTVTIPSSTGINLPFNIMTPDVESNSESTFAVNDTRKDLIEKIKLTTLTLTITSPSDADFSFLKSINVYISADGLPEIKVAWKETVPVDAGAVLNLDVSGADLKEYIKKDKFLLRLNTETDELLTSDYQVDVHSIFFVDAEILGQ